MSKEKPLINILTRTSGRPEFFRDCVHSIQNQTYKNVRHITCADDDDSFAYAKKLCDTTIRVDKIAKRVDYGIAHAPYNLYINSLLAEVDEGYILFLDDDDRFTSDTALEFISRFMEEDSLSLWRCKLPYGIVPNEEVMSYPVLIPQQVTSFGYIFHSKHKWAATWDGVKESDFRCAQRLSRLLGHKWVNAIYTEVNTEVGLGYAKDKD